MKPQPHLIALVQLQHGVIASRLVVGRSVVGVARHHHLFIAHEVDVQRHVHSQLEDVEDEDVGARHRTGEAAGWHVEHLSDVAVQQVKRNRLVKRARSKVESASGGEGHPDLLGDGVNVHGHECVRPLRRYRHVDGERVAMPRVHKVNHVRALPVRAAHLRGVTPSSWRSRGMLFIYAIHKIKPFTYLNVTVYNCVVLGAGGTCLPLELARGPPVLPCL